MNIDIKEIAEFFKVLGDPTRLRIIFLLLENKNELCVGAIANIIGITQPAVSQHLKVLKNVNLVDDTRMGYNIHYKIKKEALTTYQNFFKEISKHSVKIHNNAQKNGCKKHLNQEIE